MSQPTVTFGLYRFFTKAELDAERLRYKAEVKTANTRLAAASVNGQSFQFQVQGQPMTLAEWGDELAAAYCSLGITDYGAPGSTVALSAF